MDFDITDTAPEHKSGGAVRGDYDDFRVTFEDFKAANDERLARLEQKARRRAAGGEGRPHQCRARRPAQAHGRTGAKAARARRSAATASSATLAHREHKAAFDAYVRARRERGLARARDQGDVGRLQPDGGYLVPDEIEHEIGKRLAAISPIRAIAVGARDLRQRLQEAVHDRGSRRPAGSARPLRGRRPTRRRSTRCRSRRWSSTPCRRRPRRCSRTPPSTSTSGSRSEVEQAFAEQEGAAFVNGDGTNKPKGFLHYTKVAEALVGLGQDRLHRDRRGRRVRRRATRPTC